MEKIIRRPCRGVLKELSNLAHDAMRYSSDPQTRMGSDFSAGPPIPPVDMTFRPAAVNNVQVPGDRPSIGRRAVRAFIRFLWVACIGGAGVAWQFYGDAAKGIIARWAPQLVLTSSPPLEKRGLNAQPTPPAVHADAAEAAPPQPAPLAQTAPEDVAPSAAAPSPESAQLLQSMAGDLAHAEQEIEQLKASIAQLKASQQQMSRDFAKTSEAKVAGAKASGARASEQNLRSRLSAAVQRSATASARKPMPPLPSPQAAAPSAPRQGEPQPQATAQPQAELTPRPPMPLR